VTLGTKRGFSLIHRAQIGFTAMKTGTIRVGLLAYGAIGHEHNLAVQNTDGLEL